MKLTDDLPKWIALPLRLVLYAFVMFILFNVALSIIKGRAVNNALACSDATSANNGGLKHAKSMVTCLRQKNGFLENWLMNSVYLAIDAMPNAPKEFAGTWDASQPHCSYRHKLEANGKFISEPMGCSLSADTFHGAWGVYDNQMIWLPDEGAVWPPDINQMDVVDKDFFLLVEQDGSRTKFKRVNDVAVVPSDDTVAEVSGSDVAGDEAIKQEFESQPDQQAIAATRLGEVEPEDALFEPKYQAADPNAPIEVAVPSGKVALPVFSIPPDARQFPMLFTEEFENQFSGKLNKLTDSCPPVSGGRCNVPMSLLAQYYYMSSIPERWFDADGNSYPVKGGIYAMDYTGNTVGFDLGHPLSISGRPVVGDRILLNRMEGFSPANSLPSNKWQGWPEFHEELKSWSNQYLVHCGTTSDCRQAIAWLSSPKNFQGEAREFRLPDGRILQFLKAKSQTKGSGILVRKPDYAGDDSSPDILQTNFWRLVNADGSVRILRISYKGWLDDLGNTKLDDPYCESQCGPTWTGMPEVVSAQGRSFIVGAYAGGTVSGYLFFEILPDDLKFLGWRRWGT